MSELYEASLIAPLTEELVKGFGVLLIFVFFRREIDSVLDGLIYGSMVGFGFAAVENIFYFAGQADAGGLIVLFFLRAFIFGMLHALFTGLTGVGLALGRFSPNLLMKAVWPVLGLGAAMATHALHNYFATLGGGHLLLAILGIGCGLLWFAVTMALCLYHENRWVRIQLSEEVDLGVLYAEQALAAANFWSRSPLCGISHGIGKAWRRHRLLHEATELAYQKQKAIRHGADPGESARIAALRERVRVLSREDPSSSPAGSKRDAASRRPFRRCGGFPPPLPRRG